MKYLSIKLILNKNVECFCEIIMILCIYIVFLDKYLYIVEVYILEKNIYK